MPSTNEHIIPKDETKQMVFSCSECDYVAKKETFIKKNILSQNIKIKFKKKPNRSLKPSWNC